MPIGAALLLSAALAQAPVQVNKDRNNFDFYVEILGRYERGEVDAALRALGERPPARLREVVGSLAEYVRARREPPFSLPLAVLMHTDRALLDRELGDVEAERFQLSVARELAGQLAAVDGSEGFRRRYYLAAGLAWREGEDWSFARELLEAGLKSFPTDAGLLVARASIEEASAVFARDEEVPRRRPTVAEAKRHELGRTADARQHRLAAAELLGRAVAAAPGDETARLHLGRVQLELGRNEEGLATLAPLRQEQDHDPRSVYLALLLCGGGLERSGRSAAAIESYRAAVELEPRGQAARLALAHALDEAGLAEAGPTLAEALAAADRDPDFEDPWWTYHFERPDLLAELLGELRR